MAEENECLDELEDLLVPVTVLSTKEDDIRKASGLAAEALLEKSKSLEKVKQQSGGGKMRRTGIGNSSDGEKDKSREVDEHMEEDDEDDEFEDEGELESGSNNAVNTRTEAERRPRQPMIIPMPVMKRASLSLQEKVAIIQELEKGEKQSSICKQKRLPKSTVQSIWKNREKIIEATEKIGMGRKRCRRAQHENVEDKLVEWMETLKSQNVPVNGPQLRAKAQVFAKQLGIEEFRSSTGWLDKFKTRHNIAFKKPVKVANGGRGSSGEGGVGSSGGSAGDKKFAIDWVTKIWPNLCEGYTPENIFNADEFGLFYRVLPDQANKLANETCHGGRMAQDRLTVLLAVNSDGTEKRKLAVVGFYQLGGSINLKNLPVTYYEDSRSWMTSKVFELELLKWDEELKAANRSILVILDNSPAHRVTDSTLSNIKLVFLPPMVASILQPLEHGIIQQVKLQYRRLMLDRIVRRHLQFTRVDHHHHNFVSRRSSNADATDLSIMDAIVMLDCAWTSVPSDEILECFKNSNLQSINVSECRPTSIHIGTREAQARLDTQLFEKASCVPNLHFPSNYSLRSYSEVDSKLHVTDYINEEPQSSKSTNPPVFNFPPAEISSNVKVQEFLTLIRSWVMTLPSDLDDNSVHHSISTLENFAMKEIGQVSSITNHSPQQHHQQHPQPVLPPSQHSMLPSNGIPSRHPHNNQLHNPNRMLLNPAANNNNNNMVMNLASQHSPHVGVPMGPSAHGHSNNPNTNNSSSAATVVTFTLADSLQQSTVPHHILDQQQFFAYLT